MIVGWGAKVAFGRADWGGPVWRHPPQTNSDAIVHVDDDAIADGTKRPPWDVMLL